MTDGFCRVGSAYQAVVFMSLYSSSSSSGSRSELSL